MFNRFLKVILFVAVGTTMSLYPTERVVIQSDEDAVRAVGAQMAHIRHMLEIYSLIGTGVTYKDPQKRLESMILDYEETIKSIKKIYKSDKFVQNSIAKSKKAWEPLKKELSKALSGKETQKEMEKGAIFFHDNIRSVTKEMESMKRHFVDISGAKHFKLLDAALEVAASARRLSSHYMMRMWGLPDPTIEEHWNKGVEIFKSSLDKLSKSEFVKNPQFKKQLDIAKKSFNILTTVNKFKDKYVPIIAQDKADKAVKAGMMMTKYILEHKHK